MSNQQIFENISEKLYAFDREIVTAGEACIVGIDEAGRWPGRWSPPRPC